MSVKVSIIIPIYNIEQYLIRCMESVCNQTLSDIEIIAVNDASPDNSLAILKKFQAQDPRIIIINHKTNKKTAACRNDGLHAATGEYVCFLDGDDYLAPDFCEKLYKLAKKEHADITKGVANIVDNKGNSLSIATGNDEPDKYGKFATFSYLWTGLYNKKMLEQHNVRFYIDFFCFQIQAVYFANKIVQDDSAFYNYVRHENSCDSETFSIEKWIRLNLGHGNFMYDWINTHDYPDNIKSLYLSRIKGLYFYGFQRLLKQDVVEACKILATNMQQYYNCGYDCSNLKKLQRKLYKKQHHTTFFDYIKNILWHKI